MVRTDVLPVPMEAGVKDLAAVRPASTVRLELAAAVLAPALVESTPPTGIVLVDVPAAALVTVTVTVQEPFAGMVPLASARVPPPLAAVTVPTPHVVAPPAGVAFTTPAGYVSVNVAPVIAEVFALVSVTVSVEVPPAAMVAGAKDLAAAGC